MRGCLMRIFLLPLIVAIFYPLFSLRAPFPTFVFLTEGAEVASVIAGLFMWFTILCFLDMRRFASDRARVNKGFFTDGEQIVVSGRLAPRAPLLKAPFSGEECVGYHYEVSHTTMRPGGGISRWTDYEGFAFIPAVLKSPLGDLKILAESDKELFYEIPFTTLKSELARAESYLKTIDFGEDVRGPGDFRVDKAIGDLSDLNTCDLKEKFIGNGETVLVEGIYSTDQGGITPDPDKLFHLVPGGEAALDKKTRTRRISATVAAGLCCVTTAIYFLVFV